MTVHDIVLHAFTILARHAPTRDEFLSRAIAAFSSLHFPEMLVEEPTFLEIEGKGKPVPAYSKIVVEESEEQTGSDHVRTLAPVRAYQTSLVLGLQEQPTDSTPRGIG